MMQTLVMDAIDVKQADPGAMTRRQAEWEIPISAGDIFDVVVEPRGDMGCDGLNLVQWEVWPV